MFILVRGVVDLTEEMTGTSIYWPFEVDLIWLNNTPSFSFTYDLATKTLTIPSYTSQTIQARFRLYLVSNQASVMAPANPSIPATSKRYWENRIKSAPSITRAIDNLENGYARTQANAVVVNLSDDWAALYDKDVSFVNQGVEFYKNGVLILRTVTVSDQRGSFGLALNIQKPSQNLDQLATFGDPEHLVNIKRSTSSGFYTGSDIPEEFDNAPIPMFFGTTTPYEVSFEYTAEKGPSTGLFLTDPGGAPIGGLGPVVSLPIIPISATQGIVCRVPSYIGSGNLSIAAEELTQNPISFPRPNENLVPIGSSVVNSLITGEVVNQVIRTAPANSAEGMLVRKRNGAGDIVIIEGNVNTAGYDRFFHFTGVRIMTKDGGIPKLSGVFPTLTVLNTPGGNNLIKVNVFLANYDIRQLRIEVILTPFTGTRSAAQVLDYVLEKHGITLDSSDVSAVHAAVPTPVCLIVGGGGKVPKVSDVVQEINQSLFATIYPEKTSNTQRLKLYAEGTSSATVSSDQIKNLIVLNEGRDIYKQIDFNASYAISPEFSSYRKITKTSATADNYLFSDAGEERNHIYEGSPSRLNDIMTHYGNLQTVVEFDLLDESIEVDIADTITIDHYSFSGNIFITSVTTSDIGVRVKGQVLKI